MQWRKAQNLSNAIEHYLMLDGAERDNEQVVVSIALLLKLAQVTYNQVQP